MRERGNREYVDKSVLPLFVRPERSGAHHQEHFLVYSRELPATPARKRNELQLDRLHQLSMLLRRQLDIVRMMFAISTSGTRGWLHGAGNLGRSGGGVRTAPKKEIMMWIFVKTCVQNQHCSTTVRYTLVFNQQRSSPNYYANIYIAAPLSCVPISSAFLFPVCWWGSMPLPARWYKTSSLFVWLFALQLLPFGQKSTRSPLSPPHRNTESKR